MADPTTLSTSNARVTRSRPCDDSGTVDSGHAHAPRCRRRRVALEALAIGAAALIAGCGGSAADAEINLENGCEIAEARCQRAIFDLTSEVRGNSGAWLPSIRTITVQEYADSLRDDTDDEDDLWDEVLRVLGLLPEGASVAEASSAVAVSEVAAFYAPRTKQVTVIDRGQGEPLDDLMVLSHEFAHALQDSELDLVAFQEARASSLDSLVATKSLLEGEAMVISIEVLAAARGVPRSTIDWERGTTSLRTSFFETVTGSQAPLLAAVQVAPYLLGLSQLVPLWKAGGPDAIRAMYPAPPRSVIDWTEDTRITAQSRVQQLDCYPTVGPPGFTGYASESFGPLGTFAAAIGAGRAPESAWSRALGVRGDRVVVFSETAVPGSHAVAWRIRFDTAANAAAFSAELSTSIRPGAAAQKYDREVLFYGTTRQDRLSLWADAAHCGAEGDLPGAQEPSTSAEAALAE